MSSILGDSDEPKIGAKCLAALRQAEAAEDCAGRAPEETPRPSLCPELDIDMLEKEMLAIMATNNALEETLATKKSSGVEASEPSRGLRNAPPKSGVTGSDGPTREDYEKLRMDLEQRVEEAKAETSRISEDYAGKFKQAEQDYTEKFRQVKEVCLQLAQQINGAEEQAAKAQLCEVRAREDCEELRKQLADVVAAAAAASANSPSSPEPGKAQQIAEMQSRVDKETKECANWRRMVIEEQDKNSELQNELREARQAEREARRAEREAKRKAAGAASSASELERKVSGVGPSSNLDADVIEKLHKQLEQARATSRDSLQAAEEWKRRHDRLSAENEQLKEELKRAQGEQQ